LKAVVRHSPHPIDHPESLVDAVLPDPIPGPRDLLVSVRAVSVNPVDVKVRAATAVPGGQAKVLGYDAAGVVEAVGTQVSLFKPGDRVYYAGDITRPGSNAERQVVDERIVGRMPSSFGFAEAAALPLTAITAWELLFDRLGVNAGTEGTLLVVGAAGGVGSILVQLARHLTQMTIVGTASRPETQQWVRDLGAHHVIDHTKPLGEGLKAAGIGPVQVVASLTHTGQHYAQIVEALAPQGRLGLIDDPTTPLDVMALKRKALSLHWEMMFTRPMFQTADMQSQHDLLNRVSELIDAGHLRTTVGEHFGAITAENLKRAHALIETGHAKGKVVLEGF